MMFPPSVDAIQAPIFGVRRLDAAYFLSDRRVPRKKGPKRRQAAALQKKASPKTLVSLYTTLAVCLRLVRRGVRSAERAPSVGGFVAIADGPCHGGLVPAHLRLLASREGWG